MLYRRDEEILKQAHGGGFRQAGGAEEHTIASAIVAADNQIDPREFVTRRFPIMAEAFKEIQEQQWLTFCRKQMDYGPYNISAGTNLRNEEEVEFALKGLWFRVNDKISRLKTLLMSGRRAQNEPMIDAWADLSIYGIIAQMVSNRRWGE